MRCSQLIFSRYSESKYRVSVCPCDICFPDSFCHSDLAISKHCISFYPRLICILRVLHPVWNNCSRCRIFNRIKLIRSLIMIMRINFLVASCLHFYPEIIRHIVICFVCFEEIRISTKNNRIGTIFNIKKASHIISQCSHNAGTSIFQTGIQNIF